MLKQGESKYTQLNDKNWLYQKYWVEGLCQRKIAVIVGCSQGIVHDAFKRQGIKSRSLSEAMKGESKYAQLNDMDWLYQKYWDEELSQPKIAGIVGCSLSVVRGAFKRHGIRIRSLSEALKGKKPSEETRKKLSDVGKGRIVSKETRKKLSDAMKGKHHSVETLKKMSDAKKGEKHNYFGKKFSIETRKKLSDAMKGNKNPLGHKPSEETRKKISIAHTKLTHAQRKMNNAIRSSTGGSLKGAKNGRHWETLVGYTLSDLMQTLEKEFREGMTWENYGKWHVDHIIPLARFQYDSPDDPEFKKAWALSNLQPLWADENFKKRDKFMFF